MSLREEFVTFARGEGANVSRLCGCYGISRNTGYKWLRRYGWTERADWRIVHAPLAAGR
jgi:transposase-like protein